MDGNVFEARRQLKNDLMTGASASFIMLGGDSGIPMDTAVTDMPFHIVGDALAAAVSIGDLSGVKVRFNLTGSSPLPIQYFNPWYGPFFSIYLTFPAVAGGKLYIIVAGGSVTSLSPASASPTLNFSNDQSALLVNTATPINATLTYTSAQVSTQGYGRIVGTLLADVAGTLYVDQSNDGVNYDSISSFTYPGGSLAYAFSVEVVAPYFRIRYTDGAVNQATFRLMARTRRV